MDRALQLFDLPDYQALGLDSLAEATKGETMQATLNGSAEYAKVESHAEEETMMARRWPWLLIAEVVFAVIALAAMVSLLWR